MSTTVKAKTWICNTCIFRWQFSGEAVDVSPYDLTDAQLKKQFPEGRFAGLPAGKCPNCYSQGQLNPLGLSVDEAEMSVITVSSDEVLEATLVPELDSNGDPIMVQTDQVRYQFDPLTGRINPVPVYEPKLRPLTTTELSDLKLQRDRSLDALGQTAVKEVSPQPDISKD